MPRILFEWQRGASEAAHKAWESRWEAAWERGDERSLGPKGQAYIEKTYGQTVSAEDLARDYYDDFESPFDIEIEY